MPDRRLAPILVLGVALATPSAAQVLYGTLAGTVDNPSGGWNQ
jgi:hypothetical protein